MPKEKSLEEKLKFLQSQVRIGGKGTVRRKKKIVHQTFTTDDKKLQSALKKISVNTISGIEEVNIIKDDLSVIHFNNPKAQASLGANTFAVSGHGKHKQIVEMLPELLPQLSHETVVQLRRFASDVSGLKPLSRISEDDDVPMLVGNFDEASKNEVLSGFKNELVQEYRNLVDKSSAINSTQSISTPENEILKYVELNPVVGSQCQDSENILDSAN